jgi:hypothetical protein
VKESYNDFSKSIKLISVPLGYDEVFAEVSKALSDDYLMITKVNSEEEVEELLDDNGELKLTAPLNIFIGGQILDRGVTIRNLIGFYYGRRPGKFQQDTVLQHSRMYGNRSKEDLAVTRFYTALVIYKVMERINEFDGALREAFEKEAHSGVVFICKDVSNKILPCSPNKISLSSITTLKPYKRMLPIGFQTNYKTKIKDVLDQLDQTIFNALPDDDKNAPFLIELYLAHSIIDKIKEMLISEPDYEWDVEALKASMEFLSKNTENGKTRGKVWCLVRTNRESSRVKADGSYFDVPDTSKTEGELARQTAIDVPMLMLFRQNGNRDLGWMDSPFWWPVMMAPRKTRTMVFASESVDAD